MLAIGKDLILGGQERPAALHQIHTGQMIVPRDLLGAQMLLDGEGIVRAALDGRIIGDNHTLRPLTRPMPVMMPAAGNFPAV